MRRNINKQKITRWNESAGGIYFPEELEEISNLYLRDECHVKGIFSIACFPEGHPEEAQLLDLERGQKAVQNLIVNTGRAALAQLSRATASGLLPGAAVTVYDLGYLATGKGSAGGATLPDPTDTGLIDETTVAIIPRPLMIVTTPPPGPPFTTNLWTGQIGSAQLNGAPNNIINEAGIFCLDGAVAGTLFCFRTFANQTKSAGFIFEVRWSHIF